MMLRHACLTTTTTTTTTSFFFPNNSRKREKEERRSIFFSPLTTTSSSFGAACKASTRPWGREARDRRGSSGRTEDATRFDRNEGEEDEKKKRRAVTGRSALSSQDEETSAKKEDEDDDDGIERAAKMVGRTFRVVVVVVVRRRADANATETTTPTTDAPRTATGATSGYTRKWKKRDLSWARDAIPFYVMLPLDVVSRDGVLENKEVLEVALDALARVGVDGVMVDVWWGIVERKQPRNYDWTPYYELFQICEKLGLKVQAVMSFHACGANVGDVYEIKLPDWVLESGIQDPDLFFTDQYGYRNPECISLWADDARTVAGRTPRECYRDFMVSFRDTFENLLQSTISEIAVGCGPCGELRYPSYPENKRSPNSSQWRFPGIGEFQCYDQRALGALARHAAEVGRIEWGGSGPHDCGGYNNLPQETGFFRADRGSWDSEYGQFFLDWYAKELIKHGDKTLQTTREVFDYDITGVNVAIKCAGVHWWYNSRSHAAELTAGYFNTRSGDFAPERDGYEPIVKICAKYNARLNFTCVEMVDGDHPWFARCGPEGLLRQIRTAAAKHNVRVAGENALCRFDRSAYERVIKNARGEGDDVELWKTGEKLPPMECFTFLRMSENCSSCITLTALRSL